MKDRKELTRELLFGKLKLATVPCLICMGLSIFIVDGSLYRICESISATLSISNSTLFLIAGTTYYIVFVVIAIWYYSIFRRYITQRG